MLVLCNHGFLLARGRCNLSRPSIDKIAFRLSVPAYFSCSPLSSVGVVFGGSDLPPLSGPPTYDLFLAPAAQFPQVRSTLFFFLTPSCCFESIEGLSRTRSVDLATASRGLPMNFCAHKLLRRSIFPSSFARPAHHYFGQISRQTARFYPFQRSAGAPRQAPSLFFVRPPFSHDLFCGPPCWLKLRKTKCSFFRNPNFAVTFLCNLSPPLPAMVATVPVQASSVEAWFVFRKGWQC